MLAIDRLITTGDLLREAMTDLDRAKDALLFIDQAQFVADHSRNPVRRVEANLRIAVGMRRLSLALGDAREHQRQAGRMQDLAIKAPHLRLV